MARSAACSHFRTTAASVLAVEMRSYSPSGSNAQNSENRPMAEFKHLLEAIVGTSGDGIISADAGGRITGWNSSAERILGYRPDEAVGQPLTFIVPERFRQRHTAGFARAQKLGETRGKILEVAALHKSGAEVPIELSLSTGSTEGEQFFSAIIRDITERKRAEAELAEKEAQLRVALDNMPGGMTLEDRNRKYVLFNKQYSQLLEFPDGLIEVGGSVLDEMRFQAERGDYGPGDKDELIEQVVGLYKGGKATSWNRIQSDMGDRAVPDPWVGAKRPPVGADRALPGPQVPRAGKCASVSDSTRHALASAIAALALDYFDLIKRQHGLD